MNKVFILIFILILVIIFSQRIKESFTSHNSNDIPPTGIINQETLKKQPIVKEIKSKPTKKFLFQSDIIIPKMQDEEKRLITSYLKRHFATFKEIVRIKKEQQGSVKRYDVIFVMNDVNKNAYIHTVLTKIIVKDGRIFFNTIEYGGMILPNELPSHEDSNNLFYINNSPNKITFLDKKIEKELDKFEKRKIEILLRRGRKAA